MALPVIPETIRCAVQGVMPNGQPWVNVLHVVKDASESNAAAATRIHVSIGKLYSQTGYGAGKNGWANNASTLASVKSVTYLPLNGFSAGIVKSLVIPGTSATDALPGRNALCFTLRTDARGPRHRGRQYWGGFTETMNDSAGTPDNAPLAAFVSCWESFRAELDTAAEGSLVVASYKYATAQAVTSIDCSDQWETQRRRA